MRVLITGVEGQLGYDVKRALDIENYDIHAFGRTSLDVTNENDVNQMVNEIFPEVIIHCAAYTNVDEAESNEDRAFHINAQGTKYLAKAAEAIGSKIVYISTDYVFDGTATEPYQASDKKSPLGVYGKSKSLGEDYIKQYASKYFIIRTAWVYGSNGNNFVKTMLKLAKSHKELKVVNDQKGSPTYTYDLAKLISGIIKTENYGIYHGTNSGECTWYEFAKTIFSIKGIHIDVNPCSTEEFPRPAPRPRFSVLGHQSLVENDFASLRHWKTALQDYLLNEE